VLVDVEAHVDGERLPRLVDAAGGAQPDALGAAAGADGVAADGGGEGAHERVELAALELGREPEPALGADRAQLLDAGEARASLFARRSVGLSVDRRRAPLEEDE